MKEQRYKKSILKNLEQTNVNVYCTSQQEKKALDYPEINQSYEQIHGEIELLSLDCQMIETTKGTQLCQVFIMNSKEEVVYDEWFRPKNPIIDYVTHITGLTQDIFEANHPKEFTEETLLEIQKLVKGKIIVGHDLANDLKVLPITHHLFIDTVALFPHNLGLPFKNKLKNLALEHLNRPIQWHSHNSKEDAKAALDLAMMHIKDGRGRMVNIEAIIPEKPYSVNELISEAELDVNKIDGLFLRGSRALELEIIRKQYESDWDYFCVYSTPSTVNGRLITLYNTDITIYDTKTFYKYLNQSQDIPCIELFYLPKECQYINKLHLPPFQLGIIRQSVGFHLGKSDRKIKRFKQMLPSEKMEWKILKAYHLKMRFLDYFLQIYEKGQIFDVKRMKSQWGEAQQVYLNKGFQVAQKFISDRVQLYYGEVRKVHKSHRPLKHVDQQKHMKKKHQKVEIFSALSPGSKDELHYLLNQYINQSNPSYKNPLNLALIDQLHAHGLSRMEQYKISYQRHKIHPNLIQFHYMQSANFQNKLCRESRGIILDQFKNYEIVALPYFKFFDYNDSKFSELAKFDFKSCKVYEKYDGSFAVLYHYCGEWWVASTRFPDGTNNYCFARPETTTQFKLQFWSIFYKLGFQKPNSSDRHLTFIFQILSKNHIIVVRRQDSDLRLHGVINRQTGEQLKHQFYGQKYGWNYAKEIDVKISSIEQAVKIVQAFNPLKNQGFILRDGNNVRLKVKSSAYLRANWLAELNLTPLKNPKKYLLEEVVLSNGYEEFCNYCPEWKPIINQILDKIKYLNEECDRIYKEIKHLSKKQRSLQIMKCSQSLHPFLYALCDDYEKWNNQLHFLMPPKRMSTYLEKIMHT